MRFHNQTIKNLVMDVMENSLYLEEKGRCVIWLAGG